MPLTKHLRSPLVCFTLKKIRNNICILSYPALIKAVKMINMCLSFKDDLQLYVFTQSYFVCSQCAQVFVSSFLCFLFNMKTRFLFQQRRSEVTVQREQAGGHFHKHKDQNKRRMTPSSAPRRAVSIPQLWQMYEQHPV